jgi:hypothetical protein
MHTCRLIRDVSVPQNHVAQLPPLVRIVTATRGSLEEFEDTLLGHTIKEHSQLFNFELFVQSFNTRALAETYNTVIDLSRDDPALLLFVHDDVRITDYFWPYRLQKSLQTFDIVGLVGTTRRLPNQCSWCFTDKPGQWHDYQYLSGTVNIGWPPDTLMFYGPTFQQCQLLDAYFLAVHSDTLIRSGLRFDPQFDFHFYDLDFCRQAEVLGLTMGTVDVSVIHRSGGCHDDNWHEKYQRYLEKWKK